MKDKICGYFLDEQQQQIVVDNSKYLLVIAGAGSGKTLTILGKIHYLVNYKGVPPEEILCISFTKASSINLKEKIAKDLGLDIPVYTFHKLALNILSEDHNHPYQIISSDILEHIIHEFFSITVLENEQYMRFLLKYFDIKQVKNIRKLYCDFYENNLEKVQLLEKLISTFIRLFKCNHYCVNDFSLFLKKAKMTIHYRKYQKEKIFLILALNCYLLYKEYLEENDEMDFDDMIIKATNYVNEIGIKKEFQYVIIDEYQDTSYIRLCLIKSILDKTNAKLMVVGDDFQSIYRFTGCDISLFLNFKNYFDNAKIMKIENTYRNSQELITMASNFVMKNKWQIKKQLRSTKHLEYPLKIAYYKNIKESFFHLVLDIYNETNQPILVLGRNNKDVHLILGDNFKLKEDGKIVCQYNEKIDIYYLTVHKSKGLEEENVIIINLENKLLGFPCQIEDDKVLRFVSRNSEKYTYSEERRLFYVALTRTKNRVYLLVPLKNPSIFVQELLKSNQGKLKTCNLY